MAGYWPMGALVQPGWPDLERGSSPERGYAWIDTQDREGQERTESEPEGQGADALGACQWDWG